MKATFLLLLALLSLPASAAIQAWLGQDRITLGDSVDLTLQHDVRGDSQPDLSPLQHDFAILGRASGSSIQIVNGHMSAQTQLRLTLAPKHGGRIAIPSLTWDGERSPVLVLEVEGNGSARNAGAGTSHVFLSSTLDQKQPYVQAATPLRVRIYTDLPLVQASLDLAPSSDVLVQQAGKDSQGDETRGGHRYRVIERNYLLFPQRSGHLILPGPVLQAQVIDDRASSPFGNDPFFNRAIGNVFGNMMQTTRPLRLQGDDLVLDARPLPAGVATRDWLPAQRVELEEKWKPETGSVHAGEPITRHLRLTALGLTAAQLPDVAAMMTLPPGIKAYPDQARLNTESQDSTVSGVRDQDIALIADRPGRYLLPALHLSWWDTRENRPRLAVLPARTLEFLAVPGAASRQPALPSEPAAPVATPAPHGRNYWPWLSLTLALALLASMAALWWSRRAPAAPKPAAPKPAAPEANHSGSARKAFHQACRDNDAPAARRALLSWAHATWPLDPPIGLNALAVRVHQPGLQELLRELDRACYADHPWEGEKLAQALSALPKEEARSESSGLAELYP